MIGCTDAGSRPGVVTEGGGMRTRRLEGRRSARRATDRRTRRDWPRAARVLVVGLLVFVSTPAAIAHRANRPPNIVLIIGDDHGWAYSGFMGDPVVQTPHLDTLAEQGTLFTQAQLPASICRPALQTLLSGLHPRQWEAKRLALAAVRPIPYRQEVVHYRTLPRELARRGYRSWEGGKMWEGTYAQAGFSDGMANTTPLGLFGVEGDRFGRDGWVADRCGDTRSSDAPCPALEPLRAFLDETGDSPFFLWFAPMVPHLPFDPPAEFTELYTGRDLSPEEIVYYAQVTRLDALVGELVRELETRGVRDDTLILYVSDNGWEIGQGGFFALGHGKGSLHELGTRTPIIFHWPGHVPDGAVHDELVAAEDVFPTLLDYAGAEQLPDRDGASLRPLIEGRGRVERARYVSSFRGVAPEYRGHFVRTSRWRYMDFEDGHEELFDIVDDPFELVDLVALRPEVVVPMRAAVAEWETRIDLPAPRLEVVGRLISHDGQPIGDASLVLTSPGSPLAGPLEVITGPDGGFRFQNLPHGAHVLTPGRRLSALIDPLPITVPVGSTGRFVGEIVGIEHADPAPRRPRAGTLAGRVLTKHGAPLADATVSVRGRHRREAVSVVLRTDAGGRYLAEHLPPGRYAVEVAAPVGFQAKHVVVSVHGGRRHVRDLIVSPPHRPHRSHQPRDRREAKRERHAARH